MPAQNSAHVVLPIYQVDAFTSQLFSGNPAAVVPLRKWLPAEVMKNIAAENNLAETAFFVPLSRLRRRHNTPRFHLRWFTPQIEVPLCGHATLASGWVVLNHIVPGAHRVVFESKSGPLNVERRRLADDGEVLELDFPAQPARRMPAALLRRVADALGETPIEIWQATKLMAVMKDARAVLRAKPDFAALKALPGRGLIITAKASAAHRPADFVSRYFAPYAGINEDPVTGSAHCTLVPYWAERLGRTRLQARQVSARGGDLICELRGERVAIAGCVAPYLEGTVRVRH